MQRQRYETLRRWPAEDRAQFAKWARVALAVYAAIVTGIAIAGWSGVAPSRERTAAVATTKH